MNARSTTMRCCLSSWNRSSEDSGHEAPMQTNIELLPLQHKGSLYRAEMPFYQLYHPLNEAKKKKYVIKCYRPRGKGRGSSVMDMKLIAEPEMVPWFMEAKPQLHPHGCH